MANLEGELKSRWGRADIDAKEALLKEMGFKTVADFRRYVPAPNSASEVAHIENEVLRMKGRKKYKKTI